jgi:thioredoxin 1
MEVIAMSAMKQARVPLVDEETFSQEVLAAEVPVLVEFGAVWCSPCRALEPLLVGLAQEGAGRWKVVALDIDASPRIAAKYAVRGAPTCVVFSKGVEVSRQLGLTRRETLRALVERAGAGAAQPSP